MLGCEVVGGVHKAFQFCHGPAFGFDLGLGCLELGLILNTSTIRRTNHFTTVTAIIAFRWAVVPRVHWRDLIAFIVNAFDPTIASLPTAKLLFGTVWTVQAGIVGIADRHGIAGAFTEFGFFDLLDCLENPIREILKTI